MSQMTVSQMTLTGSEAYARWPTASTAKGRGQVTEATPILAGRSRSTSAARRQVGLLFAECLLVGIGLDGRGAPHKAPG